MTQPILPTFRHPQVLLFKERFNLKAPQKFLTYKDVGRNYRADFCHVSAKVHAMEEGGKRVHGWSCWLYPAGLMAEFHSVWEDKKGVLVDVTPPKFGSSKVLFIRDDQENIAAFNDGYGDGFLVPVNRMAPPASPYWLNGVETDEADWFYPSANESFVEYCASFSFDPANYPTDEVHG